MRIHCVVDQASDWIPKQIFEDFQRHTRHQIVAQASEAELIWVHSYYTDLNDIARPSQWWRLMKRLGRARAMPSMHLRPELSGKPILVSLHHLTPGREHEFVPKLARIDGLAVAYHFFSQVNIPFIQEFIHKPGLHLPYWIDLERFKPQSHDDRLRLRHSLGFPSDRKLIGSFQRDTEADGISPKPEKGPDILCDILERLDKDSIFVLLTGPRRDYVERRLASAGVPFRSLGHVAPESMNGLYNCLDMYLVTSRTEGGPQAILECMATRTPILSTPVGIADILQPWSLRGDVADFLSALSGPAPESDILVRHMQDVKRFDVMKIIPRYDEALESFTRAFQADPTRFVAKSSTLDWRLPKRLR